MYVSILLSFISVHHMGAQCMNSLEKSIGFPTSGVTDSCELSRGCLESNLGPLEEQPGLLTDEPSVQLLIKRHF